MEGSLMEQQLKVGRWMRTVAVLAMAIWCTGWSQEAVSDPNESTKPAASDPNNNPTAPPGQTGPAPTAEVIPTVIIRSIEFVGNKKYTDKILKQRIGIELGERYDPFLAEGGRRTIIDVYQTVGYTFVHVEWDKEQARHGRLLYVITEGPRVKIHAVRFVGNKAFSRGTLGKLLKTKQSRWLVMPGYYSDQTVRDDAEKLRSFYYKKGYLGYDVQVHTEFAANREGVVITFQIHEGPPYRVAQIVYTGNRLLSTEQLRAATELAEGRIYQKDKAEIDAKHVVGIYREKGFIEADVRQSPKFQPDVNDNRVTVEFAITEGRQFRIGRIEVTGNEVSQDKSVRRVLDEYGFTPGQLYNAKLAPPQGSGTIDRYVQRAVLAEQVLIRPEPAESGDPNQKDVRVDITEGMTGMIMPGVGVSSDSGVMGQLIYTQNNFDIKNWPQTWSEFFSMKGFRGGGQSLRIALEPGTEVSRYSVAFTNPYFRDKPISLELAGRKYKRFLESYNEGRLAGQVEFEHRQWGRWRKILGFRAENVGVLDLASDAPQEIRDVAGHSTLFGVKIGTGLTEVDDIYQPHTGHVVRMAYEQVAGHSAFGLVTASAVQYFTLYEDVLDRKTVLAAKVQLGTVVGTAPPFEKFYAGGMGQYSIRGFDYRGISTRGLQVFDNPDPNVVPQKRDPIGSNYVALANTEIVIPLIGENLSALAFADTGIIDTGHWRLSTGIGIQILVPQIFGNVPMRFEYGLPLIYEDWDETRRFNFTMGALF